MKRIILFFLISISIFSLDYKGINTIDFEIYEKTNTNNKIREKEYILKIKFPEKVYKEVLKPEINRGEIYVYNEEKTLIYYPVLEQVTEEEREVLGELEKMDKYIQAMRTNLRYGKKLNIN